MAPHEVSREDWEGWDQLLSPLSRVLTSNRSGGGASHSRGADRSATSPQGIPNARELLQPLYTLALELRDRLSFSQQIIAGLKADLAASQGNEARERSQAAGQLGGFKEEVARLSYEAHAAQLATEDASHKMAALAAENLQIQIHADKEIQARIAENEGIRAQAVAASAAWQREMASQADAMNVVVLGLEEQLRDSGERVEEVEAELEEAHAHGDLLRTEAETAQATADDATMWAQLNVARNAEATAALSALKARLADLQRVEGLFLAGRDEVARLSKEVMELKEMVVEGAAELGGSSILDSNADPDSLSAPLLLHSLHPHVRSASRDRGTLGCDPQAGFRDPRPFQRETQSDPHNRRARSSSPGPRPRFNQQVSGYPGALQQDRATGSRQGYGVSALPQLAFLGPLSADYPPNPEAYTMERVGGGFSPREDLPRAQPRASGWVPSAVVRLAQAFRHSYSLTNPMWTAWEPLLLMVDEVYRTRTASEIQSIKAAAKEKTKTLRRQLASSASYPSVVSAQRVFGQQRQQLAHLQGAGSVERRDGDVLLRSPGKKDYRMGSQLDIAVEENLILRHALAELAPAYPPEVVYTGKGSPYRMTHPLPPASSGYGRRM